MPGLGRAKGVKKMSKNMPGYDTHGPQYPQSWDRKSNEILHYDIDEESECFGEITEEPEYSLGVRVGVKCHCEDCGRTYSGSEYVNALAELKEKNDWRI